MANAAFLDLYWVNKTIDLSDDDMAKLVNDIGMYGITHQFLDLGKLNDQGHFKYDHEFEELNAFDRDTLKRWIKITRTTDKNQKIIGTVNYGFWKFNRRVTGFNPDVFTKNMNMMINDVLSLGLDGIHLDIEGFNAGDEELIEMLKYLRSDSLHGIEHVSISATHEPLLWDRAYIRRLTEYVSEINPMIYDLYHGGATSTEAYIDIFRKTIHSYSEAIKGTGCRLVPYIPSYASTNDHRSDIETMEAALQGANTAIKQGAKIDGMALFWFPQFAGYYPDHYSKSQYQKDQVAFMRDWIRK